MPGFLNATSSCRQLMATMHIVRWAGLLALAVAVSILASPVARAAEHEDGQLVPAAGQLAGFTGGQLIGEETRQLLEIPTGENPLAGHGESCFPAGHGGDVLILWTRGPKDPRTAECAVKAGTSLFMFAGFVYCDPVEAEPFFAVGEEAQQRCAVDGVHKLFEFDAIRVTVDGRPPVDIGNERFLAVSPQGTAHLPEDNVLDIPGVRNVPAQDMTFATAGYVAMLRPLSPGKHTITVEVVGGPSAGITSATVTVAASEEASTPAVAPPRASLTADWWRTLMSIPKTGDGDANPAVRCHLGIDNIVFLGATTNNDVVKRSCTLSAGTSILVPLINALCWGPSDGPTSKPGDNDGPTPADWRLCAKKLADKFVPLFVTVNGVAVENLSRLRVQSEPFQFSPVTDNIQGIPAGGRGAVSDGYWALIGPLAPGTYDVSFSGSFPPANPPFTTNVTYHLTVV